MCLIAGHHNYKFWQMDGFILFILPSKPKNQITTISATSLFPKRKTWLHYISMKTASFFSPIHQSCTRLTINRTITSFMKDRWLTSMILPLAESCPWQKGTNLKLAQNSNNLSNTRLCLLWMIAFSCSVASGKNKTNEKTICWKGIKTNLSAKPED